MSKSQSPLPTSKPRQSSISTWISNTFVALQERDFRLFFTGLFLSFTGTWARRSAVGWVLYQWTDSYEMLGYITAVMLMPLFLFSPFAGAAADKYDKRYVIMASRTLAAITSALLALMIFTDYRSVEWLFILTLVTGSGFAFEVPSRQAFVVELVGKDLLANAIALNSAMINLTRFIGPAVGGVIMYYFSPAWVFVFDAFTCIPVIVTMLMLSLKPKKTVQMKGSRLASLALGFKEAIRNERVRSMMVLQVFVIMFGWTYSAILPGIAQGELKLSELQFGFLTGVFGVGAVIGALYVAGRGKNTRPRAQAYVGIFLFFLGLFVMTVVREFYLILPCLLVAGGGAITFLSTANTVIQLNVDNEIRGRVMSVWTLIFGGCMPLGSLIVGKLAEVVPPFTAIQIMVSIGAAGSLAIFIRNRAWLAFFERNDSLGNDTDEEFQVEKVENSTRVHDH